MCNWTVITWTRQMLAGLPPREDVVEFGSANYNGSVRSLFPPGVPYWGIDIRDGDGVDEIADAATYKPPKPPDTVICNSLLEHTPDADLVVFNAWQILGPGGVLLLVAPCDPWPPHSFDGGALKDGEHYSNVSEAQMLDWASMFTDKRVWRSWDNLLCMVGVK